MRSNKIDYLLKRALSLRTQGRLPSALRKLQRVLAVNPDHFEALHGIGVLFGEMGRFDEALRFLTAAVSVEPTNFAAHYNLAKALHELKRHDEALACYDKSLSLKRDLVDAYNNRGNVLSDLHRYDDALASYDQAAALDPISAEVYHNRGNTLRAMNRYGEALASYDKALAARPGHADTMYGKGLLKLLLGDYEEGWRLCEWRWETPQRKNFARDFERPLWLGEQPISGKTILLHAEQGFGDVMQFVRYVPAVAALGATVLLEVPSPLVPLLHSLAGAPTLIAEGEGLPAFDVHCPLASLPLAFHTTVNTIPAEVPYLAPDPQKQDRWRRRLGPKRRPRVGLVWSGDPRHKNDRNRSIGLCALQPLLGLNAEFHALQKEIRHEDQPALAQLAQLHTHEEHLHDFSDTAALAAELDLLITVDTSVAHLAGALAKPVWILLPFAPDHRWLTRGHDSPWYPTARLFRQHATGRWDRLVAEVHNQLLTTLQTPG